MYCPNCGNQAPDQRKILPQLRGGHAAGRRKTERAFEVRGGAKRRAWQEAKSSGPGAGAEGKDRTALMTAIAAVPAGTAVFLVLIWTDVIKLPFLRGNESGSAAVVSSSAEGGASPAPSETPKVTSEPTQEATETPEPVPTVAVWGIHGGRF